MGCFSRDIAIFLILGLQTPDKKIWRQKTRKWPYLGQNYLNRKTKGTLPYATFKVQENKVALVFWLGPFWPSYGHFVVFWPLISISISSWTCKSVYARMNYFGAHSPKNYPKGALPMYIYTPDFFHCSPVYFMP